MMVIFNMIILNLLGNTGVAAYGVIANLSLVVLCIYTGIAQGIQPLISKAYGRYEMKTVRQLLRYALITMSVASCIIYLTLFFLQIRCRSIQHMKTTCKCKELLSLE